MNVIRFENVSFSYKNSRSILKNLNFNIDKGTTTVLLGKNGSGKTTLLKLLMNFEKPQDGKIYLNGKDIADFSILEKSKQIAYVGQDIFSQFDFQ